MTDKTKGAPARSALKLALEALESWGKGFPDNWGDLDTEAITAIREALAEQPAIKQDLTPEQQAQPQQEPVDLEAIYETIIRWDIGGGKRSRRELARRIITLYTFPPASKPLTDEEIEFIRVDQEFTEWAISKAAFRYAARAIEAAHGIKGEA